MDLSKVVAAGKVSRSPASGTGMLAAGCRQRPARNCRETATEQEQEEEEREGTRQEGRTLGLSRAKLVTVPKIPLRPMHISSLSRSILPVSRGGWSAAARERRQAGCSLPGAVSSALGQPSWLPWPCGGHILPHWQIDTHQQRRRDRSERSSDRCGTLCRPCPHAHRRRQQALLDWMSNDKRSSRSPRCHARGKG